MYRRAVNNHFLRVHLRLVVGSSASTTRSKAIRTSERAPYQPLVLSFEGAGRIFDLSVLVIEAKIRDEVPLPMAR